MAKDEAKSNPNAVEDKIDQETVEIVEEVNPKSVEAIDEVKKINKKNSKLETENQASPRDGNQADGLKKVKTKEEVTTKTHLPSTELKAPTKAGAKARRAKEEAEASDKPAKKTDAKPKPPQKPPRSRLERRGKKYRQVYENLDPSKRYSLEDALALLPKTSYEKFDSSVELHINLDVDTKKGDQAVRGTVALPHSSGKSQRVAVVAAAGDHAKARAAGADVVGEQDLLDQIQAGNFDFDVLAATPGMMQKLAKHAKELGPRGLMPNPKSGTVTSDIAKTVKELKGGRIEFRMDSGGIIHQAIGKLSLKPEQLKANAVALLQNVQEAKPSGVKGMFIKKITITTTMGPGIALDTSATVTQLKS